MIRNRVFNLKRLAVWVILLCAVQSITYAQGDDANVAFIAAEPAKQPHIALRYKLYPSRRDLMPGAAAPHFTRAVLLYMESSEQVREKWNQFQEAHESGNEVGNIEEALKPFANVLLELKKFGQCEDLSWDDRVRDLSGKELFTVLLPDMQRSRELAKILRFKCLSHLSRNEFDDAFECIRTGYRLAEFIGQGECILQSLVGIAICGVLEDCVRSAISTPGCPNLYWAIASIPKPLITCRKAVEVELAAIELALPILAEAETLKLTSEQWSERWEKDIRDIDDLLVDPDSNERDDKFAKAFGWSKEHGIAEAKKCLVSNGRNLVEINAMPIEQLIAVSSLYEVRRLSSELAKGFTLPATIRSNTLKASELKLQEYSEQHPNSVATVAMNMIAAAVQSAGQAETRSVYYMHRLMNIEALRMHLAVHEVLPSKLDELDPVQAVPNPFDGSDFTYEVNEEAGQWIATLSVKSLPPPPARLWPIKVKFAKPK